MDKLILSNYFDKNGKPIAISESDSIAGTKALEAEFADLFPLEVEYIAQLCCVCDTKMELRNDVNYCLDCAKDWYKKHGMSAEPCHVNAKKAMLMAYPELAKSQ